MAPQSGPEASKMSSKMGYAKEDSILTKKCRPREAPETLGGASWAPKCAPREPPGRPETAQMRSLEAPNAPKMTYGRSTSALSNQKWLKDVQDMHFCVLEASKIIKKRWKNEGFLKFQLF